MMSDPQELILERLDNGETLVVDEAAGRTHTLNASAAAVFDAWREGKRSLPELAERLSQSTGLPADDGLVVAALSQLEDAGLIEGDIPQLPVRQVSRRRLLELAASVGAAAATLPLVESIVTPTPAMAQSSPTAPPPPAPIPPPTPPGVG
jgi:PqqD family protein of HPr-rel-A system